MSFTRSQGLPFIVKSNGARRVRPSHRNRRVATSRRRVRPVPAACPLTVVHHISPGRTDLTVYGVSSLLLLLLLLLCTPIYYLSSASDIVARQTVSTARSWSPSFGRRRSSTTGRWNTARPNRWTETASPRTGVWSRKSRGTAIFSTSTNWWTRSRTRTSTAIVRTIPRVRFSECPKSVLTDIRVCSVIVRATLRVCEARGRKSFLT